MTPEIQSLREELEQVYDDCMKKWSKNVSHRQLWLDAMMKFANNHQTEKHETELLHDKQDH